MNFFVPSDDFENVISSLKPITTGWTNIVYKVYGKNGKYYFRFPRD